MVYPGVDPCGSRNDTPLILPLNYLTADTDTRSYLETYTEKPNNDGAKALQHQFKNQEIPIEIEGFLTNTWKPGMIQQYLLYIHMHLYQCMDAA